MDASQAGTRWPANDEIARLVRRVQVGDRGALETLLTRLRPVFLAFFARRFAWDDAEDLAQDALIGVARAAPTIDPERATAYAVRIARNLLHSERRRRVSAARRARAGEATQVLSPTTPEEEVEYQELLRAFEARLATFAPELREIARGVVRGLAPTELAAQQHVSPITVRTRLLRVRALLRPALDCYSDAVPPSSPGCVREEGSGEVNPLDLSAESPRPFVYRMLRPSLPWGPSDGPIGLARCGWEHPYDSAQNVLGGCDEEWDIRAAQRRADGFRYRIARTSARGDEPGWAGRSRAHHRRGPWVERWGQWIRETDMAR